MRNILSSVFISLFFLTAAFAEDKFVYDAKARRDPFLPLVTETGQVLDLEPKQTTTLNLEGVIFDKEGDSFIVINGVVLKKGQALNDYLVFEIKPNEVILIRGSEKIMLQLNKESDK